MSRSESETGVTERPDLVLLVAVVWTILSAVEYLRGAWDVLTGPPEK